VIQVKKMLMDDDLADHFTVAELRKYLEGRISVSKLEDEEKFAYQWRFKERGGSGYRSKELKWCYEVMGFGMEKEGFEILPSLSAGRHLSSQVPALPSYFAFPPTTEKLCCRLKARGIAAIMIALAAMVAVAVIQVLEATVVSAAAVMTVLELAVVAAKGGGSKCVAVPWWWACGHDLLEAQRRRLQQRRLKRKK
jgi:hypothetical protein